MKYATDGIDVCTSIELDLSLHRRKFPIDGAHKWDKQNHMAKRIAQSQAKKQPPEIGLYVSTKKPLGMRLVVEKVFC